MTQGNEATDLSHLRRKVRVIALLDAAESAGLVPLPVGRFHMLAYLANVLSPVWHMPTMDGKIFKRQSGPFYPVLQSDLDRLVGLGVVKISEVSHFQDQQRKWSLVANYSLNRRFADPIIEQTMSYEDERRLVSFINELALALSALSDDEMDAASRQDATYSDPVISYGNVVDFAEWQQKNFTSNAAEQFERFLPSGTHVGAAEKLHMYLRLLQARLRGTR